MLSSLGRRRCECLLDVAVRQPRCKTVDYVLDPGDVGAREDHGGAWLQIGRRKTTERVESSGLRKRMNAREPNDSLDRAALLLNEVTGAQCEVTHKLAHVVDRERSEAVVCELAPIHGPCRRQLRSKIAEVLGQFGADK